VLLIAPEIVVGPVLSVVIVLVAAPRLTAPESSRAFVPLMVNGEPLNVIGLPSTRAPPEANNFAVLPKGLIVNVPVPIGPEVTAGDPAELIPSPIPPSPKVVPPKYVFAAAKIVSPPVFCTLAVRLKLPEPETTPLNVCEVPAPL